MSSWLSYHHIWRLAMNRLDLIEQKFTYIMLYTHTHTHAHTRAHTHTYTHRAGKRSLTLL